MDADRVGPAVVLVGAPGAGKTAVGTRLAARLGLPFRDTDADVEVSVGMSVSDIFLDRGEEFFRAAEHAAVLAALAEHRGVLALGGGAILDAGTRVALAGHRVVFLDVSSAEAAKRVGLARDRPLLVEAPRTRLAALLKARRPLYAEVATLTVDTAAHQVDDVVDLVVSALPTNRHRWG